MHAHRLLFGPLRALLAACLLLAGIAPLRAQVAAPKTKEDITVIIGSKERREDADAMVRAVAAQGITAFVAQTATPSGMRYRVCVGRYADRAEADAMKKQLADKNGLRDAWLYRIPAEDAAKAAVPAGGAAQPPIDTVAFKVFYKNLLAAMAYGRNAVVDAAIHPARGLYVLHNPGVHRVAQQVKLYSQFLQLPLLSQPDAQDLYRSGLAEYAGAVPAGGPLPAYNCQTEAYSHQGLFMHPLATNEKVLAATLRSMKEYALAESLTPAEIAEAQLQEQDIRVLVRHSEGAIITGLYFAFTDGKWYLAMIDLTTPCDA
jgi:hypothetical protein